MRQSHCRPNVRRNLQSAEAVISWFEKSLKVGLTDRRYVEKERDEGSPDERTVLEGGKDRRRVEMVKTSKL